MTVPFNQVVSVIPSVLSAGGSAVDLNGLLLTQNAYAPYGQILNFASAQAVATYFGAASAEAGLAANYFNSFSKSTAKPGSLLMTLYPEAATSGFLRSASLATMTLTQLQALSGTLDITVAGTPFTSSSITLTGASSFSAAAALIQAAFTSPTFAVTFDSTKNAFIFTTTATGATATITYATGTLAAGLSLTAATGAALSQGAAIADPATFMSNVTSTLTQNWATFGTVWESIIAEKEAFATWSNSVQPRYLYVCQDSDVNAVNTPNSTEVFAYWLAQGEYIGTLPIFGDATHTAFVMGWAASLDFSRLNGRTTLDFCQQSGLATPVTTITQYSNVTGNGYNVYAAFGSNNPANNENWFTPGSVSGTWKWADTYVNQIWLNANLQLVIVNLLLAVNSVPYNAQGYSLIYAAALDPINTAVNFGAIRTGVALSNAQKAEIALVLGFDASASIYSKGFYLQIAPATAQVRAARTSPPCTLFYTDGGSIQQVVIASIEVQ